MTVYISIGMLYINRYIDLAMFYIRVCYVNIKYLSISTCMLYPTGRIHSLDFNFTIIVNDKFVKYKFS